jgi:hypothetical protein
MLYNSSVTMVKTRLNNDTALRERWQPASQRRSDLVAYTVALTVRVLEAPSRRKWDIRLVSYRVPICFLLHPVPSGISVRAISRPFVRRHCVWKALDRASGSSRRKRRNCQILSSLDLLG